MINPIILLFSFFRYRKRIKYVELLEYKKEKKAHTLQSTGLYTRRSRFSQRVVTKNMIPST